MIVDDDDVEWKFGLLFKCAVYRIANGFHAIADRDDHAAFNRECGIVVDRARGRRRQPGLDALEVGRRDLFHFNLIAAVSRIDVTEMRFFIGELDSGRGEIGGLAEVDDGASLAQPQPEVVPAAEVGGNFLLFDRISESADRGAADEDSVAEVEIVADAAKLIIDEWMRSDRAVGFQIEIVGIEDGGLGIVGRLSESLQRARR